MTDRAVDAPRCERARFPHRFMWVLIALNPSRRTSDSGREPRLFDIKEHQGIAQMTESFNGRKGGLIKQKYIRCTFPRRAVKPGGVVVALRERSGHDQAETRTSLISEGKSLSSRVNHWIEPRYPVIYAHIDPRTRRHCSPERKRSRHTGSAIVSNRSKRQGTGGRLW